MRHSLKRVKYIIISVNHQNEDRTREEFWRFSPIAIGSFMLRVFFLPFLFFSFTHSTRQQEINYSCTIIIFFSLCLDKKKQFPLRISGKCFFVFECHKSFSSFLIGPPLYYKERNFSSRRLFFFFSSSVCFLSFLSELLTLSPWLFTYICVYVSLCVCCNEKKRMKRTRKE